MLFSTESIWTMLHGIVLGGGALMGLAASLFVLWGLSSAPGRTGWHPRRACWSPEGWTVRQVVHDLPDSRPNALVRVKLALTEERPTIQPYDEAALARLDDADLDVEVSLTLLDALHVRWVALLESLGEGPWERRLIHPEIGEISLDFILQLYDWHGRHHVAHVTSLREREGS